MNTGMPILVLTKALSIADVQTTDRFVKELYRYAFNAGITAAIEACENTVPRHAECQNKIANAIQKLEKK